MRLIRRLLAAVSLLLGAAAAVLALVLQHDSPCADQSAAPPGPTMQAALRRCYGPPQVIRVGPLARPALKDDEVLVHVRAASVNPLDWHVVRGTPYLIRPELGIGRPHDPQFGVDFAGTVVAVGHAVTRYRPGDAVFGGHDGAFAEYVAVRESRAIALRPANMTEEQAATLPVAGVTALQALRDQAHVRAGDQVLVNGASGGVGTFAVQIAKSYGAEVTAVCGPASVPLMRSLGADHVIDYTRTDFTRLGTRYDVIIDNVASHGLLAYRRVMSPHGVLVAVGGTSHGNWIGPLAPALRALLMRPFVSQRFEPFLAELNGSDLAVLADLVRAGRLRSVIDRRYALADTAAAIAYVESGHAHGKVVIDLP